MEIRRGGEVVWSTTDNTDDGESPLTVAFRVLHTTFGIPETIVDHAAAELGVTDIGPGDTVSGTVTDAVSLDFTIRTYR